MAESDYASEDEVETGFMSTALNALITPFRALVSKRAQKAYLGTFLFITTSILMLCVSSIAYAIFYYKFIPQVGLERVVHLQFGDGHPWGTATVGSDLVSLQAYDVNVELELPRTPSNLAAGNFMLDLALFSHPSTSAKTGTNISSSPLARSRRPAILTYASPMVDTVNKLSLMPLYVVGWHREAEALKVQMMEKVEFPRGWRNLPDTLRLEIHSDERMQVYSAKVQFRARFTGLRWAMYNWRLSSFFVFSFMFWSTSMVSTTVVWLILAALFSGGKHGTGVKREQRSKTSIKEESDDGEDADVSSQDDHDDPSNDPSQRTIKQEDESEEGQHDAPVDGFSESHIDSATGTGLESTEARGVQRRRSHLFEGEHS